MNQESKSSLKSKLSVRACLKARRQRGTEEEPQHPALASLLTCTHDNMSTP